MQSGREWEWKERGRMEGGREEARGGWEGVSKFILSKMYKSILKNNTIQTFKNRLKVCTYSVTTWRLH